MAHRAMMLTRNVVDASKNFEAGVFALLNTLAIVRNENALLKDEPEPIISQSENRRELEINYLDTLLLEISIWTSIYTPLSAQLKTKQRYIRRKISLKDLNSVADYQSFRTTLVETLSHKSEYVTRSLEDIIDLVFNSRQLVILGDPGAGKTTTLMRIMAQLAEEAKQNPLAPIPVLIRLGSLDVHDNLTSQIQAQLGDIDFTFLMQEKRIVFLFDGYNELAKENIDNRIKQITYLVDQCQKKELGLAITCRTIDYHGKLDLNISERITINPLEPERILYFCKNHLPEDGERLFWELAGGDKVKRAWHPWQDAGVDFNTFWTATAIPAKVRPYTSKTQRNVWHQLKSEMTLLSICANPYLLFIVTQIYAEMGGSIPQESSKILGVFVKYLLTHREGVSSQSYENLDRALQNLATEIYIHQLGTGVGQEIVLKFLDNTQLHFAMSANIIDYTDKFQFSHQLLMEYFVAKKVLEHLRKSRSFNALNRRANSAISKFIREMLDIQDLEILKEIITKNTSDPLNTDNDKLERYHASHYLVMARRVFPETIINPIINEIEPVVDKWNKEQLYDDTVSEFIELFHDNLYVIENLIKRYKLSNVLENDANYVIEYSGGLELAIQKMFNHISGSYVISAKLRDIWTLVELTKRSNSKMKQRIAEGVEILDTQYHQIQEDAPSLSALYAEALEQIKSLIM